MEEVVYSGFLTKSPPEHKINRARWQRRWFVLKRNPNAVYLQYYKDQTSTRPKGTIDLNTCEQMDQGLTFESRRSLAKAFIFSIVTPKRKYFLVSNTEEDMIRWVRQICLACGFQLDTQGTDDNLAVEPQTSQPINVASQPGNGYALQQHPASVPAIPSETAESYIPLDECETGKSNDMSQSVPENGGWDSSRNQEDMFPLDVSRNRSHTGSSGSNSSIPSISAPLPPHSERDSGMMDAYTYDIPPPLQRPDSANMQPTYDIPPPLQRPDSANMQPTYDIPPPLQRPDSANMQPTYDIPPALHKQESLFKNQDAIYKPVPTQHLTDFNSSNPSSFSPEEQNKLNGDAHDLYAVPPSRDSGGLYDFPPSHPLIRNQNQEMSSSTDKLAQDFQQISVRNSRGASDDGSLDIYSVPPSSVKIATDLFTSPDDDLPRNATPPPRPPKLNPTPATTHASQPMATPPRPPKPQHLRPSSSPPCDETYDVLPGASRPVPSQELTGTPQQAPIYAVPPTNTNWTDLRSPPNGHRWLDNKVPTPDASEVRYINTKQSPSRQSLPPQSAGYLHQRRVPPSHPHRASALDSETRYSPGPMGQQESYLPMIGSNSSPSVFQYPDSYMAMEGSSNPGLRPEGRLSSDAERDTYAIMSGTSGFPVNRPLPANFHRQTFSGGQRPPPIDRSLKPDRKASEGSVRHTNSMGMAGSFYANSDDIIRPVPDLWPIQSDRTRSFSKRPGQYENQKLEGDLDLFRGRSNTGDSTTSSSEDDMYGEGRPVPPVPEEDAYIYTDGQGRLAECPITEGLSNTPIPASHPSQQKDDIEYLELSHDHHDEEPCQPPPRPPKPSSPKVEYIDLDLERMQALKQVTERREEEKDGGVSGRGTLTRRDF